MSKGAIRLTISMAHLGGKDMLRNCLASIPESCAGMPHETIVMDNDSRDGSREMMSAEFAEVRLIELDQRLGFAANHNQAQAESEAPYVCLLNNDTVLDPEALVRLVRHLDAHPRVGIVGPMVYNPDRTPQASCGPFVSLRSELLANSLPSRWLPRPVEHDGSGGICHPDWIGGVCLVTRRELWRDLNGLDEQFYLFFEETDFCRRARMRAWEVDHLLSASVIHLGAQSTGQTWIRDQRSFIYTQSQLRYFAKHHAHWERAVLRCVSALSFGLRATLWRVAGRLDQARSFWRSGSLMVRGQ